MAMERQAKDGDRDWESLVPSLCCILRSPTHMSLINFHPITARWFAEAFDAPTAAQLSGWASIREGRHTLIAAPTGSGKTLAAFLSALDDLVQEGLRAPLPDEVRVLYVSPLEALSADMHK